MLADLVIGWAEKWAGQASRREQKEMEEIRWRLKREARRRAGREWYLRAQLLARAEKMRGDVFEAEQESNNFYKITGKMGRFSDYVSGTYLAEVSLGSLI